MDAKSTDSEDLATLYHRAFAEYSTIALWNLRPVPNPTPADALAITQPLRTHGKMPGRRLAERIEILCRAHQESMGTRSNTHRLPRVPISAPLFNSAPYVKDDD